LGSPKLAGETRLWVASDGPRSSA